MASPENREAAAAPRGGAARRDRRTTTTSTTLEDAPEISDSAYDALMRELQEIEEAYPELVTPDSPTQRVGALAERAVRVRRARRQRMYSLDNAMDLDELDAWLARVRDAVGERACTLRGRAQDRRLLASRSRTRTGCSRAPPRAATGAPART